MKNNNEVSSSVIKRLPRYYRYLEDLINLGVTRISSNELSARMGLTSSQIRHDFNCFGEFGQQGYGYNVKQLQKEIGQILGIENNHNIILIGAGNLGRALATHMDFSSKGFTLTGIFDVKQALTGQMVNGIPIRNIDNLDEFCRENFPEAAILCISPESARSVVCQLTKLGIKGIWNFSQQDIILDNCDIQIENVHLSDSLMRLCYKMNNNTDRKE